jgi:hypothetical protein
MPRQPFSRSSKDRVPLARTEVPCREIRLGELVEFVASVLPDEEVGQTVRALFDLGLVSFTRILARDERAALAGL